MYLHGKQLSREGGFVGYLCHGRVLLFLCESLVGVVLMESVGTERKRTKGAPYSFASISCGTFLFEGTSAVTNQNISEKKKKMQNCVLLNTHSTHTPHTLTTMDQNRPNKVYTHTRTTLTSDPQSNANDIYQCGLEKNFAQSPNISYHHC